jgi:hypothetical protein
MTPVEGMLAHIKCMGSRLYTSVLAIDAQACVLAQGNDVSWHWHARIEHLYFGAMSIKKIARVMLSIDRVDEYSDNQRRS